MIRGRLLDVLRDAGGFAETRGNSSVGHRSHALIRLLAECGVAVESATDRSTRIRAGARFKARFEELAQTVIFETMRYIEKRMAALPGMAGIDCCTRWAARVQAMLPPETRAPSLALRLSAAPSAQNA